MSTQPSAEATNESNHARVASEAPVFQEIENGAPPDMILSSLLHAAVKIEASDLFFASSEDSVDITMRSMGIIKAVAKLPKEKGVRCLVCLRNLAGMKLDEHRRPMDGRGRLLLDDGRWLDIRVSVIPTLFGESIALRL